MAQSRKDFFEKQLRSLQDDITTLSKKLSVSGVPLTPSIAAGSLAFIWYLEYTYLHTFKRRTHADNSYSSEREATDDLVYSAKDKVENLVCVAAWLSAFLHHCIALNILQIERRRHATEADLSRLKDQNASLQKDVQIAKYEKDMAVQKLNTITAEYDLMKLNGTTWSYLPCINQRPKCTSTAFQMTVSDIARLRAVNEELKRVSSLLFPLFNTLNVQMYSGKWSSEILAGLIRADSEATERINCHAAKITSDRWAVII